MMVVKNGETTKKVELLKTALVGAKKSYTRWLKDHKIFSGH